MSPGRKIVVGVVAVNLCFAILAALSLQNSYDRDKERAIVATQNLSSLLAQQISGEIDRIDLALSATADEVTRQQKAGGIDAVALNAFLARQKSKLPFLETVRVTDVAGLNLYGPDVDPQAPVSAADRDYFLQARADPQAGLLISKPVVGRISKKWVVIFARRIKAPDGGFGGIVLAPVPVQHFSDSSSHLALGSNGTAALRASDDFGLIARFPDLGGYGQTRVSAEFQRKIEADPLAGTYVAQAGLDNIERVFSYRRVDSRPLIALIGVGTEDYVAEWRREAAKTGLLVALFATMTLVGARFIASAWSSRAEAYDQFQSLLTSAGVGIFGLDLEGNCTFCNPGALLMFGIEDESQVLGRNLHALLHHSLADGTPRPEEECHILQTLRLGEACRGEDDAYWRLDGTSFPAEYWSHALRRDGVVVGAVVTYADISDRRRAEEALEQKSGELAESNRELALSNQELEQFAYVASHDLREPLRMVASYVGLLERRFAAALDDEAREFIHFAKDGAQRMDRLILDLLEYSRIGRNRPAMTAMLMREVLDEALANLAITIEEAGAVVTVAGDLPEVVGDRSELTRLLQNLIGNAVKYHDPARSPVIDISAIHRNGEWEFAVADNGIGIPADQFERVFGIFQRLHGRDVYDGTGIGLAVCRKIVDHHGGRIWVTSQLGQGSVFGFTLPDKRK
jgi:PAS domain S-box-containing protein